MAHIFECAAVRAAAPLVLCRGCCLWGDRKQIRSNKYNINPIAVKYGGGGHAKASGATVKNFEIADNMLKDLDNLCK